MMENRQLCLHQNWQPLQNQSFASWQAHVQDGLASQDNRHALPAIDYFNTINPRRDGTKKASSKEQIANYDLPNNKLLHFIP